MNKEELIEATARIAGSRKNQTAKYVDAVFRAMQEALASGEKVRIVGFGKFEVKQRNPRIGRDPQNPEIVYDIPARNAVVFMPGRNLKKAVNEECAGEYTDESDAEYTDEET